MSVSPKIPTKIFHITAIDNLEAIARNGAVLCKRDLAAHAHTSIAYENIQQRRANTAIGAGTLHDYVPFYFAPRSPMLMTINQGNVPGCSLRQHEI